MSTDATTDPVQSFPAVRRPRPILAPTIAVARRFRNGTLRTKSPHSWWTWLKVLVIALTATPFAGVLFLATHELFRSAPDVESAVGILAALLLMVVLGGILGSAATALQSLYLADDLRLLLQLPLPTRAIFIIKFPGALVGLLPVALLAATGTLSYGVARGTTWIWMPVGALVVVGVLLLVGALAVLFVMFMARLAPARYVQITLTVMSLLLLAVIFAGSTAVLSSPDTGTFAAQSSPSEMARRLAETGSVVAATPIGWGAAAVVAAGEGSAWYALLRLSMLSGTVGCVLIASAVVFIRTFAANHARLMGDTITRDARPVITWFARALDLLPAPTAAMVLKEWLVMARDLRRLSGALVPMSMVIIYSFTLTRRTVTPPEDVPELGFWLAVAPLALLPWGASLGVSIYSVGAERRHIALLRGLPMTASQVLTGKILASFLPVGVLVVMCVSIVAGIRGASVSQLGTLIVITLWATAGYVAIDTAGSAMAPNFAATHIQRSIRLPGRLFSFLFGAVFTMTAGIAVTRLILYWTGLPQSWSVLETATISGVAIFGWPLVVVGFVGSSLVIALAFGAARENLARILSGYPPGSSGAKSRS